MVLVTARGARPGASFALTVLSGNPFPAAAACSASVTSTLWALRHVLAGSWAGWWWYGPVRVGLPARLSPSLDASAAVQVRAWQERVREQARADAGLHRVHTMLGRHRALPGYAAGKSKREVARASRAAINTPVQGSAADVVAAAMVRIHEDPKLRELGWRMLLQVHDEVCRRPPTPACLPHFSGVSCSLFRL